MSFLDSFPGSYIAFRCNDANRGEERSRTGFEAPVDRLRVLFNRTSWPMTDSGESGS